MKLQHTKTLLAVVCAATLGLGAAGNAYAQAYSTSYNDITNAILTLSPALNVDNAPLTSVDTSTAAGSLNLVGVTTGGVTLDAPVANAPANDVNQTNNSFTQLGHMLNTQYSWGDANIAATQTDPVGPGYTQVIGMSESNVHPAGDGFADASNRSTTRLETTVVLNATTNLAFAFDADPWMEVFVDALAGPGSTANADISASFTITDNTRVNLTIFSWSPDGVVGTGISCAGNATGCTETADAADLNLNITASENSSSTYDGTSPATGSFADGVYGSYAMNVNLAAGSYTLSLSMDTHTDVSRTQVSIPEPAILGLMGFGLAGLGFASRRRNKKMA